MASKKSKTKFRKDRFLNLKTAITFAILFASVGVYFLFKSYASAPPIKFYSFYPAEKCSSGDASAEVWTTASIYKNSGMNLNIKPLAYCGLHGTLWYVSYHSNIYYAFKESMNAAGWGSYVNGPGGYIMDNIRWEISQERGYAFDSPRVFMLNFNGWPMGSDGGHCGVTTIKPYHDQFKMALVFKYNCMTSKGWNQNAIGAAAAHELGHIFMGDGEQHRSDPNNLMYPDASVCASRNSCFLDSGQRSAILNYGGGAWASPTTK